eukprot:8108748-Pyramimonas_sp.AAC.1
MSEKSPSRPKKGPVGSRVSAAAQPRFQRLPSHGDGGGGPRSLGLLGRMEPLGWRPFRTLNEARTSHARRARLPRTWGE